MQQEQPSVSVSEIVAYVGELVIENRYLRKRVMDLEQQLLMTQISNGAIMEEATPELSKES